MTAPDPSYAERVRNTVAVMSDGRLRLNWKAAVAQDEQNHNPEWYAALEEAMEERNLK